MYYRLKDNLPLYDKYTHQQNANIWQIIMYINSRKMQHSTNSCFYIQLTT